MESAKYFHLGATIVYFNLWTGFEENSIREIFCALNLEEISNLAVGDEVWISADPLHPHGNVYGMMLVLITDINIVDSGIRFYHAYGHTTVPTDRLQNTLFSANETVLRQLVIRFPLSRIVMPYATDI